MDNVREKLEENEERLREKVYGLGKSKLGGPDFDGKRREAYRRFENAENLEESLDALNSYNAALNHQISRAGYLSEDASERNYINPKEVESGYQLLWDMKTELENDIMPSLLGKAKTSE